MSTDKDNTAIIHLLPHNMAAQGTETPTAHVDLDDSELTSLEKLRIRLRLTHWSKITRKNKLEEDEDVAKMIRETLISDAVKHDEMYSEWDNRYSDFLMTWKRILNPTSGKVEGHLMATDKPRFKNLGNISNGCSFSLMSGDILDQPLPTTRVANLRLNHLQFLIRFVRPCKFRDEEQENSTIFRVGNKNELYGNDRRPGKSSSRRRKKRVCYLLTF